MQQRDYILNEARKLAFLLAKLLGLKAEDNEAEYKQYFNELLQDEYNTELNALLQLSEPEFSQTLDKANYSADKLNMLSQMLYMFAEPFEGTDETFSILKKVLVIFHLLETKYGYESFDNLTKRNTIYSFFKNNYD
jgi:endonuclease III